MTGQDGSIPLIAVTAAVGAIVLLFFLLCNVLRQEKQDDGDENDKQTKTADENSAKESGSSKKQKPLAKNVKKLNTAFSHTWLASTLKGHSGRVIDFDFSPNGKYVISTADDRALMLWSCKEFQQKEHKYIRGNVDLDSATYVAFSPDSRAFITALDNDNSVRIFRLVKKDDGSHNHSITAAVTFPKKHDRDIIGVGISSSGKFIMTCSGDTTIMIWDLKGDVLATIDTHQMNNSCGKVSNCGRFVASCGFTPDVKVWEVVFDKGGNFKEVKRAFELKGHSAAVYSFDFNNDSRRMASVSKDGSWKYWNTDVQYALGQDPKLLFTGSLSFPCHTIALSPDGRTVAVASSTSIVFWDAVSGKEEEVIENVHQGEMTKMSFDITGKYLLSSGGKHIHVLHNVTGYHAIISDLQGKLRTANTEGMRQRIEEQLTEARESISNILSPSS